MSDGLIGLVAAIGLLLLAVAVMIGTTWLLQLTAFLTGVQ